MAQSREFNRVANDALHDLYRILCEAHRKELEEREKDPQPIRASRNVNINDDFLTVLEKNEKENKELIKRIDARKPERKQRREQFGKVDVSSDNTPTDVLKDFLQLDGTERKNAIKKIPGDEPYFKRALTSRILKVAYDTAKSSLRTFEETLPLVFCCAPCIGLHYGRNVPDCLSQEELRRQQPKTERPPEEPKSESDKKSSAQNDAKVSEQVNQ